MFRYLVFLGFFATLACTSGPVTRPGAMIVLPVSEARQILAATFSEDGTGIVFVVRREEICSLHRVDRSGSGETSLGQVPCGGDLRSIGPQSYLLRSRTSPALIQLGADGTITLTPGVVSRWNGESPVMLNQGDLRWSVGDQQRTLPAGVDPTTVRHLSARSIVAIDRKGETETLSKFEFEGDQKVLFENSGPINSFDVSPDKQDVVFSARRDSSFDVGLTTTSGGPIRWVPPDPADETLVTWAPRGNKIAYAIETTGGTILRSVHIPTGFQVATSFHESDLQSVSWEPRSERVAVVVSTPASSSRIDLARYDGTSSRTIVEPANRLPVEIEPFPGLDGVVLMPKGLKYSTTYPVFVWKEQASLFRWNEQRSQISRLCEAGHLVLAQGSSDSGVIARLAEFSWIDPDRVFVVERAEANQKGFPTGPTRSISALRMLRLGIDGVKSVSVKNELRCIPQLWLQQADPESSARR